MNGKGKVRAKMRNGGGKERRAKKKNVEEFVEEEGWLVHSR